MDAKWKFSLIAAISCFALSLLVGLVARNGFGWVLLRALLFGALGGCLAFLLRWAALRYLPELGGGDEADSSLGSAVDITVRDAGEEGANPFEPPRAAGPGAGSPEPVAEGEEAAPRRARARPEEPAGEPEGEETPAGAYGIAGAGALAGAEPSERPDEDFAQEVEELRSQQIIPAGDAGAPEEYETVKPPSVIEDVDVLPDMDGFQDSFSLAPAEEGSGGSPEPERESPSFSRQTSRGGAGGEDPTTLAQAIRTVLQKEKKG